jgi:hypothetical protein
MLNMIGPVAGLFGVPISFWYVGRGEGGLAWYSALICTVLSWFALGAHLAGGAPASIGLHGELGAALGASAIYHLVWAVPWLLWARRRLKRRVTGEKLNPSLKAEDAS